MKREYRGSESCDKNIVSFIASSEMLKSEDGMKDWAKEGLLWGVGGFFVIVVVTFFLPRLSVLG